jgi:peptide subunit release factor 1 (eRF1)
MAIAQPRVSDLDAATLRRLAQFRADNGPVLTLYVDLDPTEFATPQARETEIRSLLTEAETRAAPERDIARVREYLGEDPPVEGVGALAVFSCEPAGLFEVVRVPEPVPHGVDVADTPNVERLAEHIRDDRWCVLLVNRPSARILRGSSAALREAQMFDDVVHRQHKQGGWSQARYERSVEEDVARHLDHVDQAMRSMLERSPYDHVLLGTTEELAPHVERSLHPAVADRIAGRFAVDVDNAAVDDVFERARPVMEEVERATERMLLDRLAEGLGPSGMAAAGSEDVFKALIELRVGTLLLDGAEGWGEAIELALRQAADVRMIRHHTDLALHESVAALLRF